MNVTVVLAARFFCLIFLFPSPLPAEQEAGYRRSYCSGDNIPLKPRIVLFELRYDPDVSFSFEFMLIFRPLPFLSVEPGLTQSTISIHWSKSVQLSPFLFVSELSLNRVMFRVKLPFERMISIEISFGSKLIVGWHDSICRNRSKRGEIGECH